MRILWKPLNIAVAVIINSSLLLSPTLQAEETQQLTAFEAGKKLSFTRKKGNCLACHQMQGGQAGGNIGPPLISMKLRFPDKAKLRAQISDATIANPHTMMPPFGRHGALSDTEIDKVTDFVYSL